MAKIIIFVMFLFSRAYTEKIGEALFPGHIPSFSILNRGSLGMRLLEIIKRWDYHAEMHNEYKFRAR